MSGNSGAGFGVEEPFVSELVAIRIGGSRGVQSYGSSRLGLQSYRRFAGLAIDDNNGVVIGVVDVFDGPIHAGGKVMLERRSPSPDGRLIGGVGLIVNADDRVP